MTAPGSPVPVPPDPFVPPTAGELSRMLPAYEVSHLIAAGGMGAVYAGTQRALDRAVAIKILPPDAARDGESIGRFRTEAKAMARLTHPNIPAVYDFDVSDGYCYLVMEFIDGWNVHQLITQGGLNPDLTYSLLSQVCDALNFAHQRGIVHGDIKPSNLLVTQEGSLKLADFGLAQLTGSREDEAYSTMGTPEYAAPELWQPGVAMDHRADLYSLGCVFYEMLTGAPPQGEFQLPAAALTLDPRVDGVISRCMQQKPELRYQSAAEVKQAIEAIRQATPAPAGKPAVRVMRPPARRPGRASAQPRHRTKKQSSPAPWIGLGLLAAAAIGGIVVWNGRSAPADAAAPPPATPPDRVSSTVTPPPPPPVLPPAERPVAVEAPTPTLTETPETLSPETAEKLTAFRAKYRAAWESEVAAPITEERGRISSFYLTALEKIREEAAKSNDPATGSEARKEADRFKSTRSGLPDSQFSPSPKVSTLQKTLTESLDKMAEKNKPLADQLKERCLLELKQIETDAASGDQKAVSELYDKIVAATDLVPVLSD